MPYSFSGLDEQCKKTKEWLIGEIGVLRTGRANPSMVKDIVVDYYNVKTKLEGLASIGTQDARTLIIQPWDKEAFEAIEKAIRNSNIGLSPVADKDVIRLILPELTGERREMLLKMIGEKLEEARISLRQARDEIWKDVQEQKRSGVISEDEKFRLKDELQKRVDDFNDELEALIEKKRIEIRS